MAATDCTYPGEIEKEDGAEWPLSKLTKKRSGNVHGYLDRKIVRANQMVLLPPATMLTMMTERKTNADRASSFIFFLEYRGVQ